MATNFSEWPALSGKGSASARYPMGPGDDGGGLRGGVAQGAVVEMGVDCRGFTLPMSEQSPHRAQSDAVHHALGSPSVPAVVDGRPGSSASSRTPTQNV